MSKLWIATIAFVVSISGVASAGGALRVKIRPPKKGEIVKVEGHVEGDGHAKMDGHDAPLTLALDESWTQTYLAVDHDVVTKERVTFTAAHEKSNGKDDDQPIANKSYVATAADGKVSFTDDQGGAVTDAEQKVLAKTIDNVGSPDRTTALFAGKEFTKGVAVALSGADLLALASMGDLPAANITLTLTDSDRKRAHFELRGAFDGDQNGLKMSVTFEGSLSVDLARGRLLDFDLTGEMKATSDPNAPHKAEIEMKIVGKRAFTYR